LIGSLCYVARSARLRFIYFMLLNWQVKTDRVDSSLNSMFTRSLLVRACFYVVLGLFKRSIALFNFVKT